MLTHVADIMVVFIQMILLIGFLRFIRLFGMY